MCGISTTSARVPWPGALASVPRGLQQDHVDTLGSWTEGSRGSSGTGCWRLSSFQLSSLFFFCVSCHEPLLYRGNPVCPRKTFLSAMLVRARYCKIGRSSDACCSIRDKLLTWVMAEAQAVDDFATTFKLDDSCKDRWTLQGEWRRRLNEMSKPSQRRWSSRYHNWTAQRSPVELFVEEDEGESGLCTGLRNLALSRVDDWEGPLLLRDA